MTAFTSGQATLDEVCDEHGAFAGFRLSLEYFPGPPPFPESDEEAVWLKKRETLTMTLLELPDGGLFLGRRVVGNRESTTAVVLALDRARELVAALDQRGAWDTPALDVVKLGAGWIEPLHEAYEYRDDGDDDDDDLDLDLDSWQAPRSHRIARARTNCSGVDAEQLLEVYRPLLTEKMCGGPKLAELVHV